MHSETKRCPYCDEVIRAAAVKCKYCGSDLRDGAGIHDSGGDSGRSATIADHTNRAKAHIEEGEYREAETEIESALRLDPDNNALENLREEIDELVQGKHVANAAALMKAHKFEQATFEYQAALDRNPENAEARRGLRRSRRILRQLDEHVQKGDGYRRQKKYEEAIEEFEQVLKINPDHKYARSEIEQCRLICTEHSLLSARTSEELEIAKSDYESKRYGEAISSTRKILEKVPDHGEALRLLERSRADRFARWRNIAILVVVLVTTIVYAFIMFGAWNYRQYRSHLAKAQEAAEAKNWQQAIDLCGTALTYKPDAEEATELLFRSIRRLHKQIEDAKEKAFWARKRAEKAGAVLYARDLYKQAVETQEIAESFISARDYITAEKRFLEAAKTYLAAQEKAYLAVAELQRSEAAKVRAKREKATFARSEAVKTQEESDEVGAHWFPIEAYATAREKLEAGDESFQKREYDLAMQFFEEAIAQFLQSAESARDGAFLPDGLEMQDGKIVALKDGAEMVFVPAGSYQAGSPEGEGAGNEYPQHPVHVQAFYMDAHEVTIDQYKEFLQQTGRKPPPDFPGTDPSMEDYPAVGMSRDDAIAYAQWAGKRLPTEAEWEYACRAGTTTKYHAGRDIDHSHANYAGVKGKDQWKNAALVGSFSPNAWGLFDMHGNVWEWCQDWYGRTYYTNCPPESPQGPKKGTQAVIRGGSWKESKYYLRSAARGYYPPADSRDDLGFRCVK